MAKKRKFSDLTTQETDMFLKMIESFNQGLSEEDEAKKSVIASLDYIAAKLAEVQHVPFSWSTRPCCNMSGIEVDVSILPEFRMEAMRFAASYGGIVNLLIVKGPPVSIGFFTRRTRASARDYKPGHVSYCRQHKDMTSATSRHVSQTGVVVFNAANSSEGGTVSISDEFLLGEDLSGLLPVLGLLLSNLGLNAIPSS